MRKQHILYIVAIVFILNLVFIENSTYSLSYESSVGIGFTFNPTLSVSLSSSDLIIPNLTPGSSEDSNNINVSIATNASYGYILSVNANSDYLTHSNNIDTFSSIAADASLQNLTTDNTWGYSTKLPNETNWNNYNGLSNSTNTTLIDNSNTADSTGSIDFKIGAKASSTQASGIYTNTINFIAVSKVAPTSLLDAFIASGAEQLNGYYKMQDMTHDICNNVDIEESELQLIDVRDNKIYWVAKLKDGNCWMTQNLDLDLSHEVALTSDNTDLNDYSLSGAYTDGYDYYENSKIIVWTPKNSTITYDDLNSATWQNSIIYPYSYNYLDNNGDPVYPDVNVPKELAGNHGLSGNYYNWSAMIASNDASSLANGTTGNTSNNPKNSICPRGWRLPIATYSNSTNEFAILNTVYNNGLNNDATNLMAKPLWFIRAGAVSTGSISNLGNVAFYRSSTIYGEMQTLIMKFNSNNISTSEIPYGIKASGFSMRCLAK